MAKGRLNLMDPPIEDLLDKVDSKFTLVALGALRARQVNAYYNSLGEGLGRVVPPQVASVSGKPLSIAFEEIAASKATYTRVDPELEAAEAEAAEAAQAAELELTAIEGGLAEGALAEGIEVENVEVEVESIEVESVEMETSEIVSSEVESAQTEGSAELSEDEGPAAG